jgi:hypothetical protein
MYPVRNILRNQTPFTARNVRDGVAKPRPAQAYLLFFRTFRLFIADIRKRFKELDDVRLFLRR